MELKFDNVIADTDNKSLLIVPYGIEMAELSKYAKSQELLIVPYGIEIPRRTISIHLNAHF